MMLRNFALSISIDPDILILDKRLNVPDASLKRKAGTMIKNVFERFSIVVVASHNTNRLAHLCSCRVLLSCGHLTAEGTMEDTTSAHTSAPRAQEMDSIRRPLFHNLCVEPHTKPRLGRNAGFLNSSFGKTILKNIQDT